MGLLDKVHFKAEDTTDKIVLKVGELAKEAAKAFVSFGEVAAEAKEAGSLPPGEECIKARTESVTRVDLTSAFDPLSRTERSEERREGKECVSTCRYRGSPSHSKKNKRKE